MPDLVVVDGGVHQTRGLHRTPLGAARHAGQSLLHERHRRAGADQHAVGFGAGIERLILAIEREDGGIEPPADPGTTEV